MRDIWRLEGSVRDYLRLGGCVRELKGVRDIERLRERYLEMRRLDER